MVKKTWCIPEITQEFVDQMNSVLELYERPYDPKEPIVCFDEKSKQLLADVRPPLPIEPGKPQRIDSEYVRNGTANIFTMVEPKAGWRHVIVTKNRAAIDFAFAIETLVGKYSTAKRVHVVLDNLNIHREKSLIKAFGEKKASKLMKRISFNHTPVHGSWLDMAEIEIAVMETECLRGRRIPDREYLKRELKAWENRRNRAKAKINWRFTRKKAKEKFKLAGKGKPT